MENQGEGTGVQPLRLLGGKPGVQGCVPVAGERHLHRTPPPLPRPPLPSSAPYPLRGTSTHLRAPSSWKALLRPHPKLGLPLASLPPPLPPALRPQTPPEPVPPGPQFALTSTLETRVCGHGGCPWPGGRRPGHRTGG